MEGDERRQLMVALSDLHARATALSHRILEDALALGHLQREIAWTATRIAAADPPRFIHPVVAAPPRILRLPEVSKLIGLGRSTLWRMVKEQQFPPPCRLGPRSVGWFEADVRGWIEGRRAGPNL